MGSGVPRQLKIGSGPQPVMQPRVSRNSVTAEGTEARAVSIAAARCSGPRARPSALLAADGDRPLINLHPADDHQHYPMLQRNLVYAGVTRGKSLVVLVGQRKALAIAVKGARRRERWSKLREWLIT